MDKSSGEVVTLTPNASNTVQPVALMRLGVFVPTLKSLKNSKKNTFSRTDATEELTRLSLARAEGFDEVEITGPRLDMDKFLYKTVLVHGLLHPLTYLYMYYNCIEIGSYYILYIEFPIFY